MVDVELLSDNGAGKILIQLLHGLTDFVENNPDSAKVILESLIYDCVEPLAADDFFGTEGWEHAFGPFAASFKA